MDWTLRPARSDDLPALTTLIEDAYQSAKAVISSLPDVTAGIEESFQNEEIWVAVDDEVKLGVLILSQQPPNLRVVNIAVSSITQGHGLGGALLEQAEKRARELGLNELVLTTHAQMARNIVLYMHLGWKLVERKGQAVSMAKSLSPSETA